MDVGIASIGPVEIGLMSVVAPVLTMCDDARHRVQE